MLDHAERDKQLASAIRHDFGATLRAVVQFASLIERRMDDSLDDKVRYWLNLIHDNGVHAQHMLEGLNTYLLHALTDSNLKSFSMHSVVQTALGSLKSFLEATHADVSIPEDDLELFGDASLWEFAITCVLKNAILFQDQGAIPDVSVHFETIEGAKVISVSDNGIGVSEDNWPLITAPFKRLNGDEYPGLGMGLSHVQRIVEMHDGSLTFAHAQAEGLTVTMTVNNP